MDHVHGDATLVHASPRQPDEWDYLVAVDDGLAAFEAYLVLASAAVCAQDDEYPVSVDSAIVRVNVGVVDHRGRPIDLEEYKTFLREIGYLLPEGEDFQDNVDAAIEIVRDLQNEVGLRWQTNAWSVADEHAAAARRRLGRGPDLEPCARIRSRPDGVVGNRGGFPAVLCAVGHRYVAGQAG